MVFYAVDAPLKFQVNGHEKNGEIEEYLKELEDRKQGVIERTVARMPDVVTKKDFTNALVLN